MIHSQSTNLPPDVFLLPEQRAFFEQVSGHIHSLFPLLSVSSAQKAVFFDFLWALRGTFTFYLYVFRQMGCEIRPLTDKKRPGTVFSGYTEGIQQKLRQKGKN